MPRGKTSSRVGRFDDRSYDYLFDSPEAPRPQENFLFNERYFACVYQTGGGFSRYTDPDGYATEIVSGDIVPAGNTHSRLVYVRDDDTGEFWNVGYYPACVPYESYSCRHGAGRSCISSTTGGVRADWEFLVPRGEDPVELWSVELSNATRRTRRLSVFAFVEFSLRSKVNLYGHEGFIHTCLLKNGRGVGVKKTTMGMPHPFFAGVFMSRERFSSWDGDWNAFVEQFRTLAAPAAVARGRCSDSVVSSGRAAGVLHFRFRLAPGRSWKNRFLVGAADTNRIEWSARRLAKRYLDDSRHFAKAWKQTPEHWERFTGRVTVRTPDRDLDALFNRWIPLLVEWGVTCGRWGMLGFRDIVQQSQGALMFHADDKPRRRLMQALSHQHRNGLGVRSFPTVHSDSKMRYSDSSLWLVFALTEYLKESGDFSLLKEGIPFLDGGKDTAWGHLKRAMDTLWKDRGARGLCRIHQGDWNDSLTHVGREGRGESVWLTQAFCAACLRMEELARYLGDGRQASLHVRRHALLTKVLNSKAWDGGWYVRAFDDDGKPIGSKRNRYGRIFLNTQTWALLSHTVPARRIKTMLKNTRRFLWTPYGYSLLHPTYMERRDNVGRLSCVEPGCAENGSVYTHGNAFLAVALLEHGMAEEGFEAIRRIMPCNPENPSDSVIPFQLANGYGGPAHRTDPGRAAYGWSTGSGAWLHQAMVEYLFGLRRTYDGLVLRPCLPALWRDVSVSRVYRGTTYRVRCRRRKGKGNRILSLEIDGRSADPCAPLPVRKGREVEVDVRL